jgi:hypothetical protein
MFDTSKVTFHMLPLNITVAADQNCNHEFLTFNLGVLAQAIDWYKFDGEVTDGQFIKVNTGLAVVEPNCLVLQVNVTDQQFSYLNTHESASIFQPSQPVVMWFTCLQFL